MCLHKFLVIKHEYKTPAALFSPLPTLQEEALVILKLVVFFWVPLALQVFCLLVITSMNHSSSFFYFYSSSNTWLFPSIPVQAIVMSHFRVRSGGQRLNLDLVGCSRTLCSPNFSAALTKLATPRNDSTSQILRLNLLFSNQNLLPFLVPHQ